MKAIPVEINWHPGLSIYAAEPFLKMAGDDYGWLGGVDDSGELRCILPYTINHKASVRMVRFRDQTLALQEELSIEDEKSFLSSVVQYFRFTGADIIIPATANAIFRTYPEGAVAAPYGTFFIDLRQPIEILWSNLHSKHRNRIRNAVKNGIEIRSGREYTQIAYELIEHTLKRSKMGFTSHEEFKRLVSSLDTQVKIFVACSQGAVQGCAVIPFSEHSAYYLYGGSIPDPTSGAMNLLHWEAISYFHGLKVRRYDFMGVRINPEKGSKQEGLMMFKERFGGRMDRGYMWKYPLRPLKAAIYSLGVRLLKGGDVVDAEHGKLET